MDKGSSSELMEHDSVTDVYDSSGFDECIDTLGSFGSELLSEMDMVCRAGTGFNNVSNIVGIGAKSCRMSRISSAITDKIIIILCTVF